MKRLILFTVVNASLLVLIVTGLEFTASKYVQKPANFFISSWRVNHIWRPNSTRVHREWTKKNPEFPEPYIHTYKKQGWIETYDIEPQKLDGVYRIFYVGDSFTEGTAPMNQSVPSIVERKLNEMVKDKGLRFEVINTGTSSYSPIIVYVLKSYEV